MKGVAAERPISWIVTMLGWFRAEAERASISKRDSRTGSRDISPESALSATSRPRRVSRAR